MKILNFGSLNIDHVYQVPHFVRPGETLLSSDYKRNAGGKGLNQTIALTRAGIRAYHGGSVGPDGAFLIGLLQDAGADVSLIHRQETKVTGHAVIQVTPGGENSIVLFGGANQSITPGQIRETLRDFAAGDFLLLQNEINALGDIISAGHQKAMRIFFNPAPMNQSVHELPLQWIDTFIVNEIEAAELAGAESAQDPGSLLQRLHQAYPQASHLLTCGAKGAFYFSHETEEITEVPAFKAGTVRDTTAAGDTFIGYFLAGLARGNTPGQALKTAARAAGICVTRAGAAASIPRADEIEIE